MITIELWQDDHPRWPALSAYVVALENNVYAMSDDDPVPFFAAVALDGERQFVGYHVCLVQPIGPEMYVPTITDRDGQPLLEAKVRALRVEETYRSQGIGTRLQQATLAHATKIGCFQMRSRSAIDKVENYSIKIKLGFAGHPDRRTRKDGSYKYGVYWVKRLG